MTKYTLIGLLAVCATVLCFSLIFRERLCELNIHRGNTVVQVTFKTSFCAHSFCAT
ncbi:TPA: type I toxin-antitoxin system Hok family toxin [Klebsiella pneumoniae]|nr:type I toxin-antitoxin system Hok family toxin [Klebsiella pneumoniae]